MTERNYKILNSNHQEFKSMNCGKEGQIGLLVCRTSSEKEYTGIPDLPYSNRLIELEYAQVTDRKVRGLLRNVGDVEKQVCD